VANGENRLDRPGELGPLMQMLAALEQRNDEIWWDVHPALIPLVAEEQSAYGSQSFRWS
jgi:hypothetical protein